MRAPANPITANPSEGSAARAADATAVAPTAGQAAAKPSGRLGGKVTRPGGDTAYMAGAIVIAAVVLLVLLRYGLNGVLGD